MYKKKLLYGDRPEDPRPPDAGLPRAPDDIWFNQRAPRFIAMVERLRQGLSTAFQEQAHRIQMRAALGRLGKG